MPIRRARSGDFPAIAAIYAAAFHDESLNTILMPYRNEYPADYLKTWTHRISENWWDYKRVSIVSYEIEQGRERLTGVAEWAREGDGWEKLWGIKGRWDPRLLVLPILRVFHRLYRVVFGNRASVRPTPSDPNPLTDLTWDAAISPFISKFFVPPSSKTEPQGSESSSESDTSCIVTSQAATSNPPFYELVSLGVLPKCHGLGYGRALTAWGLNLARKQNLPAVVMAAEGKERFYQLCGFTNLVGYASEGEGNPLEKLKVKGGAILWTEPSNYKDKANATDIESKIES